MVIGGRFSSAKTPYQPNSVIDFADRVWTSTEAVDYAPFGIWTDKDGNRFQFADEGFCLVDDTEVQTGWTIFFDLSDVKDGVDGKSLIVQYSVDGVNWHDTFAEGDVYMRQKLGDDGVWSEKIRIVGEAGAAGENGEYTEYEFAVGDSVDVSGMSLRLIYGGRSELVNEGFDYSPKELLSPGPQEITVTYAGHSIKFSINVKDKAASPSPNPSATQAPSATTAPESAQPSETPARVDRDHQARDVNALVKIIFAVAVISLIGLAGYIFWMQKKGKR